MGCCARGGPAQAEESILSPEVLLGQHCSQAFELEVSDLPFTSVQSSDPGYHFPFINPFIPFHKASTRPGFGWLQGWFRALELSVGGKE